MCGLCSLVKSSQSLKKSNWSVFETGHLFRSGYSTASDSAYLKIPFPQTKVKRITWELFIR